MAPKRTEEIMEGLVGGKGAALKASDKLPPVTKLDEVLAENKRLKAQLAWYERKRK